MGMVGADVDQLRALARTLGQAADRLESMTGTVTNMLGQTAWRGPDADQYRSDWRSSSMGQVRAAVAALREAAAAVNRNAAAQEAASSDDGGTGVAGLFLGSSGPTVPTPWGGVTLPGGGYVDIMLDRIPFVDARDFLNTNPIWPITWGTALGPLDKWGALPLIDALGLASDSSLTDEQKIFQAQNSMTDLAGGLLKGGGGPVGYLSGVAVAQWGDVVAQTAQADFSAATLQNTADYIAQDPGGAFEAARDAVIGYVPKLFSNVVPW